MDREETARDEGGICSPKTGQVYETVEYIGSGRINAGCRIAYRRLRYLKEFLGYHFFEPVDFSPDCFAPREVLIPVGSIVTLKAV